MGRNRTLGSPFEIATIRSSQTTEAHVDMYAVDAALGSPVVLTLDPNAFNGDQVVVQDVADNAGTQPTRPVDGLGCGLQRHHLPPGWRNVWRRYDVDRRATGYLQGQRRARHAGAYTGTFMDMKSSDAINEAYEPAVLANWSGTAPTNVANALDRIAAKIGPIP